MNIAFSTTGYPRWDARTVIEKAAEHGYAGVELRSLPEQLHIPLADELENKAESLLSAAEAKNVRILCLATDAAFSERDGRLLEANKSQVLGHVELASRLGCPYVRMLAGRIPELPVRVLGKERRDATMLRISRTLGEVGNVAAAKGVTILVENSGDFRESAELWQLAEGANSPGVQCAWNPIAAYSVGELASTAIPRLASRLRLVRVCDARFDERRQVSEHVALGEGELDVYRMVQLLRGVGYRGALVFDHPSVFKADDSVDEVLAAAATKLGELLKEEAVQLTAYKADKFPPRQGYDLIETTQPE